MTRAAGSLSLSAGNCVNTETQNSQEQQSGPYITVEDPQSGYKYVYVVIGKNFRLLISCQPLKDKQQGTEAGEKQQAENGFAAKQEPTATVNGMEQLKYTAYAAAQGLLMLPKQEGTKLEDNLFEKIRTWKKYGVVSELSESNLNTPQ